MTAALDRLAHTARGILTTIKREGPRTATELGYALGVSGEGIRQHLRGLERDGYVTLARDDVGEKGGRPAHRYGLSAAGENLFPKRYDDLAVILIDAVGDRLGSEALTQVLASVVDAKVAQWAPRLRHLADAERLEALRAIYVQDDPWVDVETGEQGTMLVERNCPFLDVAARRPALCSVTVNALSRLLGRRVERVRTFQAGHGRCAFRVTDEPFEPDAPFQVEPIRPRRVGKGPAA